MALSHAILVSLLEEPLTGYDLGKKFDMSIGFFWQASHQQIYAELKKLRDKGLIRSQTVEQANRPNRVVYFIEDEGVHVLEDWATRESKVPSTKDDFMIKLFALDVINPSIICNEIRSRLQRHEQRLELYYLIRGKNYKYPKDLPLAAKGRYLGLSAGIRHEVNRIDWCKEVLELLE